MDKIATKFYSKFKLKLNYVIDHSFMCMNIIFLITPLIPFYPNPFLILNFIILHLFSYMYQYNTSFEKNIGQETMRLNCILTYSILNMLEQIVLKRTLDMSRNISKNK